VKRFWRLRDLIPVGLAPLVPCLYTRCLCLRHPLISDLLVCLHRVSCQLVLGRLQVPRYSLDILQATFQFFRKVPALVDVFLTNVSNDPNEPSPALQRRYQEMQARPNDLGSVIGGSAWLELRMMGRNMTSSSSSSCWCCSASLADAVSSSAALVFFLVTSSRHVLL
jgi:hypothetical protein